MTGFAASWRKAKPLAAPMEIFIRANHGRETEYSVVSTKANRPLNQQQNANYIILVFFLNESI
jgi:hypothetical protein